MGSELDILGILDGVARQTIDWADELGVLGTAAVGMATIRGDGRVVVVSQLLATKLVRTELRDNADSGSNYGAVAYAKMLRRARRELDVDTYPEVRRGEVDFRGDAAFSRGSVVYLVTFSGHPTEEVDNRIARDGLLALWLVVDAAMQRE